MEGEDKSVRNILSKAPSSPKLMDRPAFPSSNVQDVLLGRTSVNLGGKETPRSRSFFVASNRGSTSSFNSSISRIEIPEELRVLAKEFQGDGENLNHSGSFRKELPSGLKRESVTMIGLNRERKLTLRKRAWEVDEPVQVEKVPSSKEEKDDEDELDLFESTEYQGRPFNLQESGEMNGSPQSPRHIRLFQNGSGSGSPGSSPNSSRRDLRESMMENDQEDPIHKTLRNVQKQHQEKYSAQKDSIRKVITSNPSMKSQHNSIVIKQKNSIIGDDFYLPHLFASRGSPWVRYYPSKNSDRKGWPKNMFGSASNVPRPKKISDGEKPVSEKAEMSGPSPTIASILRASVDKRSSRDEGEMDGIKFKGKIAHKINSINKKLEVTNQEIKDIQTKRLKLYLRGRGKVEKYKAFGPRSSEVVKSFRSVVQTKFIMMETEQNIELLKITALQERFSLLSDIYYALSSMRNESFTVTPSNRKILESTHKYLERDPDIKQQVKLLKKLRSQLKAQVAVYKRFDKSHWDIGNYANLLADIREENVTVTPGRQYYEERIAPIRPGKSNGIRCWNFIQRRFDCFLLDQRSREGKQISRFLQELKLEYPYVVGDLKREEYGINGSVEPILPTDISDFPKFLAETILTRNKIPRFSNPMEEDIGQIFNNNELKLEIGIQRCIFPLIHDYCFAYSVNNPKTFDKVQDDSKRFAKNQKILKILPFSECPIDFSFLPKDWDTSKELISLPEVQDALEELNSMVYQLTPIDMVYCIQRVLNLIVKAVKAIVGDKQKDVGADDIFPVFLYLLVFSCIGKHPFKSINGIIEISIWHYVQFMNDFLNESEVSGEAGYCFVTLQAALRHITEIEMIEFEDLKMY